MVIPQDLKRFAQSYLKQNVRANERFSTVQLLWCEECSQLHVRVDGECKCGAKKMKAIMKVDRRRGAVEYTHILQIVEAE